ncbi:MAG: bifunctional adenosylcobinamide kinase/adenosylcobinamide-phosphate guanylyltransferase [Selenomonadaceae bacterium]|nr:bifunctional adenosylcobinamide kinase/adenosylcobinamide-phosphate guanylyltransferase [Selenomonadaceae bacterium]
MGKIILVTGGARSGKSAFAEKLAASLGKNIAYIATAEIYDGEMAYRVALHQKRRPAGWKTFEAPREAHVALATAKKNYDVALFDCLTMYLSNMLCAMPDSFSPEECHNAVTSKIAALVQAAEETAGTTIFVTNEVGGGIVPENKLARIYRDEAGLMNQQVVAAAHQVYLVTCGIPVDIKKLGEHLA